MISGSPGWVHARGEPALWCSDLPLVQRPPTALISLKRRFMSPNRRSVSARRSSSRRIVSSCLSSTEVRRSSTLPTRSSSRPTQDLKSLDRCQHLCSKKRVRPGGATCYHQAIDHAELRLSPEVDSRSSAPSLFSQYTEAEQLNNGTYRIAPIKPVAARDVRRTHKRCALSKDSCSPTNNFGVDIDA